MTSSRSPARTDGEDRARSPADVGQAVRADPPAPPDRSAAHAALSRGSRCRDDRRDHRAAARGTWPPGFIASSRCWRDAFTQGALTMNEPEPDIQRLWHDQPREEHTMSIDEIRSKAKQFEWKVRRWNSGHRRLIRPGDRRGSLAGVEGAALLERVGDLLTIAALIYVMYRFRGRCPRRRCRPGWG